MIFNDRQEKLVLTAMIKKYGKTNYTNLAKELNVSRTALYKAKNNDPSFDKLRNKIVEWAKNQK